MRTKISHPALNAQRPTILSQSAHEFVEDYWPVGGVMGGVPSGGGAGSGTPGAVVGPVGAPGWPPWPGIAICCMGLQINSHNSYVSPPWETRSESCLTLLATPTM